jgi:hypothetical protein
LFILLPLLLLLVAVSGVSSVAGVILSDMGLDWWMNSRLIPLFASVVGFGLLSWGAIKSMKSANVRSLDSMTQFRNQIAASTSVHDLEMASNTRLEPTREQSGQKTEHVSAQLRR